MANSVACFGQTDDRLRGLSSWWSSFWGRVRQESPAVPSLVTTKRARRSSLRARRKN